MSLSKMLSAVLIAVSILFLALQSLGQEFNAFGAKALGMLLLFVLYRTSVSKKNTLFMLFLIAYAMADFYNYATYNLLPPKGITYDLYYLVGNALYISAYLCLIFRILLLMDFKEAFLKFPYQLLLLFALDVFIVWVLVDLVRPSQVIDYIYFVELIYNLVIMVLVSLSLVNYMQNDTKKSMNLLIGAIFIIFSEVIQITYFYVSTAGQAFAVIYSVFLVLAFGFFFFQSKIPQEPYTTYSDRQKIDV